jgi:hypothetical protein
VLDFLIFHCSQNLAPVNAKCLVLSPNKVLNMIVYLKETFFYLSEQLVFQYCSCAMSLDIFC